jgi:hypothetical protein
MRSLCCAGNQATSPFFCQERGHAISASVVGNSHEHGKSAGTFNQGGDLRFAAFPDDQISFPETGYRAIVGFGGTLTDVDHVWDLSTAQSRPGSGYSPRPTLS